MGQRSALAQKGASPHLLVMSATPIPRTLALMVYGDLDISVLDELPPGRQKIETYLIDPAKRARAFGYVQRLSLIHISFCGNPLSEAMLKGGGQPPLPGGRFQPTAAALWPGRFGRMASFSTHFLLR